jgi:homopolymeric O-antigen transport system ATP-binding protein
MSDIVISAERLSKKYTLGAQDGRHYGLRHAIQDFATAPLRRLREVRARRLAAAAEPFYALKDVSFDVERGEVVGIVGRNGAGKSTLLKLLTRITEPSAGHARLRGRVASLLEVGTGFHPELTGRENVFLNGAILGMMRGEIARKFDEIAAFANVAQFLDTPVKRYSSGMYVRLAFAVAAHLEPDILLVDEVLAVGDAEFQKKCLGKMKEVTRQGRTVIFVSHSMSAIRNLCSRVICLERGSIIADGSTNAVVATYLQQGYVTRAEISGDELTRRTERGGWGRRDRDVLFCRKVAVVDADGEPRDRFGSDEEIAVEVTYETLESHSDFRLVLSIVDDDNVKVLTAQTADDPANPTYELSPGVRVSRCTIPANLFGEHRFFVSLRLVFPHVEELVLERILAFDVTFTGYNNIQYLTHKESFIRPQLAWQSHRLVESEAVAAEV